MKKFEIGQNLAELIVFLALLLFVIIMVKL